MDERMIKRLIKIKGELQNMVFGCYETDWGKDIKKLLKILDKLIKEN